MEVTLQAISQPNAGVATAGWRPKCAPNPAIRWYVNAAASFQNHSAMFRL